MKKYEEPHTLELCLANRNTKSFSNGYQMWKWASSNSRNMEFKDEGREEVSLSEFFRKRNSYK